MLTGTGSALVLAGGVTGILALVRADDVQDGLPDQNCLDTTCPSSRRSSIESEVDPAVQLGTISVAMLLVGVGLTATGLVLWLTDASQEPRTAAVLRSPRPLTIRF